MWSLSSFYNDNGDYDFGPVVMPYLYPSFNGSLDIPQIQI